MIKDDEILFKILNKKLREAGEFLDLICAGGYVLSYYSLKSTQDIDSFYSSNKKIDAIIKSIGDDYGLNTQDEVWLNNSIQNMNKRPPLEVCKTIFSFSNLTVRIPPLDYVLCMKLYSARRKDIKDAAKIVKKYEIKSQKEIENILKKYNFSFADDSIVLEVLGEAYGMEWLEEYYKNNFNLEDI